MKAFRYMAAKKALTVLCHEATEKQKKLLEKNLPASTFMGMLTKEARKLFGEPVVLEAYIRIPDGELIAETRSKGDVWKKDPNFLQDCRDLEPGRYSKLYDMLPGVFQAIKGALYGCPMAIDFVVNTKKHRYGTRMWETIDEEIVEKILSSYDPKMTEASDGN